jgi:hypothetical protein
MYIRAQPPSAPKPVLGDRQMRKLLGPVLALFLAVLMWPQAQPKSAHARTPQAIVPAKRLSAYGSPIKTATLVTLSVQRSVKTRREAIPRGATAQCPGWLVQSSRHSQATCSHHGGVWRNG